ncbi:MAG: SH3 domain-containing protein [Paracoccaceae bacterium]
MKFFLSLAILLLSTTYAVAQDVYLPALHDVSGVSSTDTLNVRQGPGVSHPIIQALDHNQRSVSILQTSEDGKWGMIGFGEGIGWVSMRYLSLQAGQDFQALPQPLNCYGTEPGWALEIDRSFASFNDFSEPEQSLALNWQGTAAGMQPYAYGVRLSGEGQEIQAVITRAQCDDGMSDRMFGFDIHAILSGSLGNRMFTGCCSLN